MATRTAKHIIGIGFEGIGNVFGAGDNDEPLRSLFVTRAGGEREFFRHSEVSGPTSQSNLAIDQQGFELSATLIDDFGQTETEAEPFNSTMRFSSLTVKFHAYDIVAELFQKTGKRAVTELIGPAFPIATRLAMGDTGLEDTIVYIGEETMLLTNEVSGQPGVYDVERGLFGSRATFHAKGTNVFTEVPFWNGRATHIYSLDLDNPPFKWQCRWAGRIDGGVKTDQTHTTIDLTQREGLAALDNSFINLDQTPLSTRMIGWRKLGRGSDDTEVEARGSMSFESKVLKSLNGTNSTWVQINNGLYRLSGRGKQKSIRSRELGSPSEDSTPNSATANEVFVVDRIGDASVSPRNWRSSTAMLRILPNTYGSVSLNFKNRYPFHPLAVFAALMFSDRDTRPDTDEFNILRAPHWSANLRYLFSEDIFERIHELIQQTISYQIDWFVLGWNSEPVNVFEDVIKPLMHAFGFYFGLDTSGLLTINHLKLPDVDDVEDIPNQQLEALPDVLQWVDGTEFTVEAVSSTVGKLPWTNGTNQLVRAVDGEEQRTSAFVQSSGVKFDLRTVSNDNHRITRDLITNRMLIQHHGVPRLRVRVDDHTVTGQDYSIGKIVGLKNLPVTSAVLVGKDGLRTLDVENNEDFYGYIIARQYDFSTSTYELEIMLSGDRTIRWRAPSAVIYDVEQEGDGTGIINLEGDQFVVNGVTQISAFDNPLGDGLYFNPGDEIQIYTRSGALRSSEVATVQSGGNTEILTETWPFSVQPQRYDIVRLSHLGAYTNTSVKNQTDLAYTYMGTVAGLGTDSEDNHQYG